MGARELTVHGSSLYRTEATLGHTHQHDGYVVDLALNGSVNPVIPIRTTKYRRPLEGTTVHPDSSTAIQEICFCKSSMGAETEKGKISEFGPLEDCSCKYRYATGLQSYIKVDPVCSFIF